MKISQTSVKMFLFKDTQYNVSPFALFKTNWAIIKSADSRMYVSLRQRWTNEMEGTIIVARYKETSKILASEIKSGILVSSSLF